MIDPTTWIVSDGAAGNELQALALARGLGIDAPRVLRLRARWPWAALAPQWAPVVPASAWTPEPLSAPWPRLAIGAGRTGAAALMSIGKASAGATRSVQILDPRVAPASFDLVIAPTHDRLVAPNVIVIDGSLHAIDEAWLARERAAHAEVGALPGPRLVVLVGGPRRRTEFGGAEIERLAATIANWRTRKGSVLLIGSRRTPAAWTEALHARVGAVEHSWFNDQDGANPYRGALAWGDTFIVTGDSVNMHSEALGTGKPVYSLGSVDPTSKPGRFRRSQIDAGRLRMLEGPIESWRYAPLRELARILPAVHAGLATLASARG